MFTRASHAGHALSGQCLLSERAFGDDTKDVIDARKKKSTLEFPCRRQVTDAPESTWQEEFDHNNRYTGWTRIIIVISRTVFKLSYSNLHDGRLMHSIKCLCSFRWPWPWWKFTEGRQKKTSTLNKYLDNKTSNRTVGYFLHDVDCDFENIYMAWPSVYYLIQRNYIAVF